MSCDQRYTRYSDWVHLIPWIGYTMSDIPLYMHAHITNLQCNISLIFQSSIAEYKGLLQEYKETLGP